MAFFWWKSNSKNHLESRSLTSRLVIVDDDDMSDRQCALNFCNENVKAFWFFCEISFRCERIFFSTLNHWYFSKEVHSCVYSNNYFPSIQNSTEISKIMTSRNVPFWEHSEKVLILKYFLSGFLDPKYSKIFSLS